MKIKEFNNKMIGFINRHLHGIYFGVITGLEYMYINSIGVSIGRKCKFKGWTSFFRTSGSKIVIGTSCCFNSNSYTNHIGLNHRCIISTMSKHAYIQIGEKSGFSSTTINCFKKIIIGNNVRVGANCIIMDGDFHLDDPRTPTPKPIFIGDNVWLGAGVVVMKGVEIGENAIIGTNSVVTRSVPANCIAAGSPCKIIKQIENNMQ